MWSPRRRHSCLKCGFLSINGREANQDTRITLAAQGKAGWFTKETTIDCFRGLWFWDVGDADLYEPAKPRFNCKGFRRHTPGRSPDWHLDQEDKDREFRQKLVLTVVPPLFALIGGSLIGGIKLALSAGAIALLGLVAVFSLRHH